MNHGKWVIFLILILFSASASAEFYKYRDKDGTIRYTDDLSSVPEDQRPGLKIIDEYRRDTFPASGDAGKQSNQISPNENETKNQTKTDDTEEIGKRLERQKEMLDKERNALDKERKALLKEKEAFVSSRRFKSGEDSIVIKKLKNLTEKIEKLNKKMQQTEKKQMAFDAEVKAFNARLKETQKQ